MVVRFDKSQMSSTQKTAEGFLKISSAVTRTGIFNYLNEDGTTRREYRHPDEVFKADSLDTMRMKPVTNNHHGLINPKNMKQFTVGSIGETVSRGVLNGVDVVNASFIVTEDSAVKDIEANNKRGISLGYTCILIPADQGKMATLPIEDRYDFYQTEIKYNHLAIVKDGRAGVIARINMDGNEEFEDKEPFTQTEEKRMVKVTIDGLEYEAAPEVAKAFSKVVAKADELETSAKSLKTDVEKLSAERDAHKERADKAENKDFTPEVNARISLLRKAEPFVASDVKTKLDTMDTLAIQKAVIGALSPSINLDSATPEYVSARFDIAIELAAQNADGGQRAKGLPIPRQDANDDKDPDNARKVMIARASNGFKKEVK